MSKLNVAQSVPISFWNLLSHHCPALTGHCPKTLGTSMAPCPSFAFPLLQSPTSACLFQTELGAPFAETPAAHTPLPSPCPGGDWTCRRFQLLGLTVSARGQGCAVSTWKPRASVGPHAEICSANETTFKWAATARSVAGYQRKSLHQPLCLLTPRAHHSWWPLLQPDNSVSSWPLSQGHGSSSAPHCLDGSYPLARA